MVKITTPLLSPEAVVKETKTDDSGCVATYVGLIMDNSKGKKVLSVEYSDPDGSAENSLQQIINEAMKKWQLNAMTIHHRIGKLKVGDINLVVAVAAGHRVECFAACQFAIDQFKDRLPTKKRETYTDGSFCGDF